MIDHFFFFLGEVCRKYFADSFTVLDWKNVSVLHAVGLSERGIFTNAIYLPGSASEKLLAVLVHLSWQVFLRRQYYLDRFLFRAH